MVEEKYGSWICLSLLFLPIQALSLYLYVEQPLTRDQAQASCAKYEGGRLARNTEDLEQRIKTIHPTVPKSWIGDHTVMSPWIQMKGCYSPDVVADCDAYTMSYDVTQTDRDHVTKWSVGICQRFCSGSRLFAIQDKKCFCLKMSEKRLLFLNLRVSDDRCRYFCIEGSGGACGGRSGISVYQIEDNARKETDQTMTSSPSLCSVLNTKTRRFSQQNCSLRAGTICVKYNPDLKSVTYYTYDRKTDWFESRKYCRKQNGVLPDTWQPEMSDRGVYWTGRFRELLVISNHDKQKDSNVIRVSCQSLKYDQGTFNFMSKPCDQRLPYICQANSTSLEITTESDTDIQTTQMTTFFKGTVTHHATTSNPMTTNSKYYTPNNLVTKPNPKVSTNLNPKVFTTLNDKVPTTPKIGFIGRESGSDVTTKPVIQKKNSSYTLAVLVIFSCAFVSLIVILLLFRQLRKNTKRNNEGNMVSVEMMKDSHTVKTTDSNEKLPAGK